MSRKAQDANPSVICDRVSSRTAIETKTATMATIDAMVSHGKSHIRNFNVTPAASALRRRTNWDPAMRM